MRPENRFLVMRRAPMIGRPTSPARISVYHRARVLQWALDTAVYAADRDRKHGLRSSYWICLAGTKAVRS